MVATCIYQGLTRRRLDCVYLSCLPFSYACVFLLLHFGTDLSLGMMCWIALLIGDGPAAMLAAIIIGAGSASFEIMRDLVEKLPIMIAPRWVKSLCQPIAIEDVLYYLEAVAGNKECLGKIFVFHGLQESGQIAVCLFYVFDKGERLIQDEKSQHCAQHPQGRILNGQ